MKSAISARLNIAKDHVKFGDFGLALIEVKKAVELLMECYPNNQSAKVELSPTPSPEVIEEIKPILPDRRYKHEHYAPKIKHLRGKGFSYRTIANVLGIKHPQTVKAIEDAQYSKRNKVEEAKKALLEFEQLAQL
jgi:hypothetical protein